MSDYAQKGWRLFSHDPQIKAWADHVVGLAETLTQNFDMQKKWLRHGKTWFAGVNALTNDEQGAIKGGAPLSGAAINWIVQTYGAQIWDKGQISVVYAGYPQQDAQESDAAHKYRKIRDAAHVDGLMPIGPVRRRFLREGHGFVLGIPLNGVQASPFTIWEGSHLIMQRAFADAFSGIAPAGYPQVDITDVYHQARRECFAHCPRVEIQARLGECYVVHRHALHGVAPWAAHIPPSPSGRMIAYFRPALRGGLQNWL